jgi:hypothetical protein
MRTTTVLTLLVSFVFTVTVMCLEPRHPSCRILLFPGLAIAFGMFRMFAVNVAGRATFVWSLATVFNTLIYSATTLLPLWIVRRFWPRRHSGRH